MEILLTIIIPAYNNNDLGYRLLNQLDKQMQEGVEVILIDDYSNDPYKSDYSWLKIIRLEKNSGCASIPRNVGLDNAKGEYICFIDVDDEVTYDYIDTILKKIKNEDFDYCYFGWRSDHFFIIIDDEPPIWNCCVWNCIYKKSLIGNERFNPELVIGEDYDFNQRVRKGKKAIISKVLYQYNDTPNSLIKRGR